MLSGNRMLAALAAPALMLAVATCRAPRPAQDVFIITVDTLRADRLGFDGYAAARTPAMDGIAADGARFVNAITPMPRTTPALASMMTGLEPHAHGSREVGEPMLAGTTLASRLQAAGYWTAAVSANATAGPEQGLGAGFSRFIDYDELLARGGERMYRDLTPATPDGPGMATVTTTAALALLEAAPADQPLLLWVHYLDPHFLYRPPSPWQDGVDAPACWQLYEWGAQDLSRAGAIFNDLDGVAAAARDDCSRLYDAEVAYVDSEVGRLMRAIEGRRGAADAIVVLAADHGENLGEQGLYFEHGDNAHDAALRVPLVFRAPGVEPGATLAVPASLVDVAPTISGLMGLLGSETPAGIDLAPLLRRPAEAPPEVRDMVFAESAGALFVEGVQHLTTGRGGRRACLNQAPWSLCREWSDGGPLWQLFDHVADPRLENDLIEAQRRAVDFLMAAWERWPPGSARYRVARGARFKLVDSPLAQGGYARALFDLQDDVAERNDVSARFPEVAARMGRALDAWSSAVPLPRQRVLDAQLADRLRALGYLQ